MNEPNRANYNPRNGHIKVMCPVCGAGGAHPLSWNQPKCHVCNYEVLMLPASNTKCVCTWEEAVEYFIQELK